MKVISDLVVYLLMFSAAVGCFYSIKDPNSELGKQFVAGIESIGGLFIPIAGIMAALPILNTLISNYIAPVFTIFGADPSIAATSLLAVDMGGYQLAQALSNSTEAWVLSLSVGYMAGATIVFSIPIATKIVKKQFHRQLSIGMMIGFITIPLGVFITNILIMLLNPHVRTLVSSDPTAKTTLINLTLPLILINILPLAILCVGLAIGMWKKPESMIRGFNLFSKAIETFTKIVLLISIIEHFTGFFSFIFGTYVLDPIIADSLDQERALEVAGYIGLMLSGALPLVYIIEKKLRKPMNKISEKIGISNRITTGLLASSANVIAAFSMIDESMEDHEIISIVAFSVCGAFVIGDHLAFTANFQPQLIVPLIVGKLSAGIIAVIISQKIYKNRTVNVK